jgi:acyl carrier protein
MGQKHTLGRIQGEIRTYIAENILFGGSQQLELDESFQESGVLDSTGFLELIAFVEERYGIDIAGDELVPEHFDTLERTSRFVEQKLSRTVSDSRSASQEMNA